MGRSHGPKAKVEGARISEKELIGDRGIERTVALDSRKLETPKPDIEFGKGHGEVRKGRECEERTYGSGI